VTSLYMVLIVF